MEKKVNKSFYLLSSLNTIPALILGGGLTLDSLVLIAIIVALVLNHQMLVRAVSQLTRSVADEGSSSKALQGLLLAMLFKMLLLGSVVGLIVFYDKNLVARAMGIIIFQLIIQVVSITTNQQKN
jgi:hypothetical protein